jgi:hypothetical protein
LAYVKQDGITLGARDLADVPSDLEDSVIEAAEECPGACIFIEDHEQIPYTPETEGTLPRVR